MDGQAGEEKTRFSKRGYTVFGVVTGLIALILFPPVFGVASILSGVQLFRHYDEQYGMAVMIWGGITLVAGVLLGMYMWSG
jgi:hypothetical protein